LLVVVVVTFSVWLVRLSANVLELWIG
jgi:hypothetical protein